MTHGELKGSMGHTRPVGSTGVTPDLEAPWLDEAEIQTECEKEETNFLSTPLSLRI